MDVRGGDHAQLPPHRLGVAVNNRKTLMVGGGNILILDGIQDGALWVVVQGNWNVANGVWNYLAE